MRPIREWIFSFAWPGWIPLTRWPFCWHDDLSVDSQWILAICETWMIGKLVSILTSILMRESPCYINERITLLSWWITQRTGFRMLLDWSSLLISSPPVIPWFCVRGLHQVNQVGWPEGRVEEMSVGVWWESGRRDVCCDGRVEEGMMEQMG